jgi:hypothetical protein
MEWDWTSSLKIVWAWNGNGLNVCGLEVELELEISKFSDTNWNAVLNGFLMSSFNPNLNTQCKT